MRAVDSILSGMGHKVALEREKAAVKLQRLLADEEGRFVCSYSLAVDHPPLHSIPLLCLESLLAGLPCWSGCTLVRTRRPAGDIFGACS